MSTFRNSARGTASKKPATGWTAARAEVAKRAAAGKALKASQKATAAGWSQQLVNVLTAGDV
eukprot:5714533-Prymnesium_polylepis.1